MPEVSRAFYARKDAGASISEIKDGIYRVSGLVPEYGIFPLTNFRMDDIYIYISQAVIGSIFL
jgi:hypothetical protein